MAEIKYLLEKINRGDNDLFSEMYGDDPLVLKNQAEVYNGLVRKFGTFFGKSNADLFSSPGRTEIGGNHTDHNMGRVLAGSVSLDNIAVAAKNNSNKIRIESNGYPGFEIDITDPGPIEGEKFLSSALVRGIATEIRKAGYQCEGFDACIDGRVPKGSGLSSSASFEVLIGTIISTLFNDGGIDPVRIAIIGQYAENNYFGNQNKDQQDQESEQDQDQDQGDGNQSPEQEQEQQSRTDQISQEEALRMLEAAERDDQRVQEKLNEQKKSERQPVTGRNW